MSGTRFVAIIMENGDSLPKSNMDTESMFAGHTVVIDFQAKQFGILYPKQMSRYLLYAMIQDLFNSKTLMNDGGKTSERFTGFPSESTLREIV